MKPVIFRTRLWLVLLLIEALDLVLLTLSVADLHFQAFGSTIPPDVTELPLTGSWTTITLWPDGVIPYNMTSDMYGKFVPTS